MALVSLVFVLLCSIKVANAVHSRWSASWHEPLEVLGRRGYVYWPASLPLSGASVSPPAAVLVLHGSQEAASDMFGVGLEAIADSRGDFMVAYPEMARPYGDSWGYEEDLPYFQAFVARLQEFGVDASNVFICGHSAGGSMTYYLQNQLDLFAAAGAVESAVGHLDLWDMTKSGVRTMIVWNHADPVLEQWAPTGGESAYLDLTVRTLRRAVNSTESPRPATSALPVTHVVQQADMQIFTADRGAPEIHVLGFTSNPGRHTWAQASWTGSVDASEELVLFFLGEGPGWITQSLRRYRVLVALAVLALMLAVLLSLLMTAARLRSQGSRAFWFGSVATLLKRGGDLPALPLFLSPGSDWTRSGKQSGSSARTMWVWKGAVKRDAVLPGTTLSDSLLGA